MKRAYRSAGSSDAGRKRSLLPLLVAALATVACGEMEPGAGQTRNGQPSAWTNAAPFPEARTELSATTDGQRLYAIGGFAAGASGRGTTAPRTMWSYEPQANRWSEEGLIPEGVNHAGFVHVGGKLYIMGGFREASFTPTGAVRIYDLATRQWRTGSPMPTPRGAAAVVVAAGKIHVIGGNVEDAGAVHEHDRAGVTRDNSVATHEVYDPATDRWERLPPMSISRNHHGAAVVNGRIHVVGGRANGDYELTAHEAFDLATGRWEALPPMPTGRSGIAVVARADRIYVFGGESPRSGTFDEAERFDPGRGVWERLSAMPSSRHGLGAAVLGDQIHVVSGGPTPGMSFGSAHEKLGPIP